MKTWMVLGGNQEPQEYDFASWLQGSNLSQDNIAGVVDTDLPFVHMEKATMYQKK